MRQSTAPVRTPRHSLDYVYGTRAWKQLRAAVKARDGYRCRRCGQPAQQNDPLVVAHIHPTWFLINTIGNPYQPV